TEGGLDAAGREGELRPCMDALRAAGIRVSLFIEPAERQIEAAFRLGAPLVELHTGKYCDSEGAAAEAELARLRSAAGLAHRAGLQVNAGHGIHLGNLAGILTLPNLHTLNIGHSLIARAVFIGLEAAVREMLAGMAAYKGGE
ncbi:MAG: pyridoxine 5'-phosphate synthase, partial [Kiritimatiellia bacterium]|nr:pyridoxine 5'-phosphate synthase [Kiritimatiellia bacterium]